MIIRSIDLETTGFEPTDKVVQIGWADLVAAHGLAFDVFGPKGIMVDPEISIPPETSAIHHIIDDDVEGCPTWGDFGGPPSIISPPGMVIDAFCAHNARFEQQWLKPPVPWICTYKCALRVWPEAPNHQNQTLRYWLNPSGLDRGLASVAHRAPEDAYVTAFICRELLGKASLEQLIKWSAEPALLIKCSFGKHRGSLWKELPKDYLRWILGQDFDEDARYTAKYWLNK